MFPSIKKNPFYDKVISIKASLDIRAKSVILGLLASSAVSFSSTSIQETSPNNIAYTLEEQHSYKDFIIKPIASSWSEDFMNHRKPNDKSRPTHAAHASSSGYDQGYYNES